MQAYASTGFSVLWYKNDNAIGIRRKSDKKQVMSFRSKNHSEEQMRKIADGCLRRLDAGQTIQIVKDWAVSRT